MLSATMNNLVILTQSQELFSEIKAVLVKNSDLTLYQSSAEDLTNSLIEYGPMLVVCDYSLIAEIPILKKQLSALTKEIPVIIVNGKEEVLAAVEMLRSGFSGYLLEKALDQLDTSVRRIMREAAAKAGQKAFKERVSQVAKFLDENPNLVLRVSRSGKLLYSNSAAKAMLHSIHMEEQNEFWSEIRKHVGECLDILDVVKTDIHCGPRIFSASFAPSLGDGCAGVYAEDVTDRKKIEAELRKLSSAVEQSPSIVVITDTEGNIEYVNRKFTEVTGYQSEEVIGKSPRVLKSGKHDAEFYRKMWETINAGEEWKGEFHNKRKDGTLYWEAATISPIKNRKGEILNFLALKEDITEKRNLELQLLHAQKLESVGQLAAGIAHELNTPIQFIGDNLTFLKDAVEDMLKAFSEIEASVTEATQNPSCQQSVSRAKALMEEIDLDYLKQEMPEAIKQSLEGTARVSKIVRAMKEFAHPGHSEKSFFNLNDAIKTTVTVARNEWKYVADMELDLSPDLPLVPCLVDEFNQVILNLIINAVHTIEKSLQAENRSADKGKITVRSETLEDTVRISIVDTGSGIPESAQDRIFDPFFTTKEVGKGTGQGLAISRNVIVEKHKGDLYFETEAGKGTIFFIRLPLSDKSESGEQT